MFEWIMNTKLRFKIMASYRQEIEPLCLNTLVEFLLTEMEDSDSFISNCVYQLCLNLKTN